MTNEKRLIYANAFEANIRKMFIPYGDGTYPGDYQAMIHDETLVDVLETIEEAPTVDAVEVIHGRWVWDVETHGDPMYGIDEDFGYRCSECQVWADEYGVDSDIYEEPPTHILRYCPNCGAKMDGDANV